MYNELGTLMAILSINVIIANLFLLIVMLIVGIRYNISYELNKEIPINKLAAIIKGAAHINSFEEVTITSPETLKVKCRFAKIYINIQNQTMFFKCKSNGFINFITSVWFVLSFISIIESLGGALILMIPCVIIRYNIKNSMKRNARRITEAFVYQANTNPSWMSK